jgi:hypothetical protein
MAIINLVKLMSGTRQSVSLDAMLNRIDLLFLRLINHLMLDLLLKI